jgi:hypothetical protein
MRSIGLLFDGKVESVPSMVDEGDDGQASLLRALQHHDVAL